MTARIRGINIYALLTVLFIVLSRGQLQNINFLSNQSLANLYSKPEMSHHTSLEKVEYTISYNSIYNSYHYNYIINI